jgi:alginate O-acetyltransferase complex protein AlgI
MAFSSLVFLLFFLPIFLLVYYVTPKVFRNWVIVLGGYIFYAWGAPRFAFFLLLMIAIDYVLSRVIAWKNGQEKKYQARVLLIFSLLANIGLLGYFKYSNFFVGQVNAFLPLLHLSPMPWREVILPIGVSFTVLQELSYIIEVYRGTIKPARSVIDFAAYLLLFPHVIAGPIVRYIDIAGQLLARTYTRVGFFEGIRRFCLGLAKKVLIANTMSGIADAVFYLHTVRELSSPLAWLGIVAYAMQIYFDFSGYSDMAIGLARMLGFHFLENFNQPYLATSITDLWRRWHISLSTWMREYLYIPLGGNRVAKWRMYLNLWIVFLVSGLWHGANWNFIIWGGFHGLFLVLDKMFWLKTSARLPAFVNRALTFVMILVGWVFFRIENIHDAGLFIVRLFNLSTWFTPIAVRWTEVLDYRGIFTLILALGICFVPATRFAQKFATWLRAWQEGWKVFATSAYSLGLLVLSLCALVNAQFNPFIYFRF